MTTDPLRAAFLADIIANPEDDVPRLIFADWLQDHGGEERAEFIRVQIAITQARTPEARSALLRRESVLWRLVCDLLADEVPYGLHVVTDARELSDSATPQAVYRRGFVYYVKCLLDTWLRHGPGIAARHPVGVVRLTGRVPGATPDGFMWCLHHQFPFNVSLANLLPSCFRLPGDPPHPEFPAPDDARVWASRRAIAWARKQSEGQQHG